ncbi:cytochrome c oxidase subunit II [Magnetospirillum sulfuroxidans]|uniref:Cytochrome c oxidase subunit 2 n=1 Tax=Magnetospirillum sulfuroxidans TaxID=611300 RepID=A0ABS5I799_9PROT|nr:cytochrome c oxidase subunit II [Magnetospirillum sulfuroxidans]MBR9970296.1 cytochrome c oxidase subunit II [Magnetospirillum sulfuroxidans]
MRRLASVAVTAGMGLPALALADQPIPWATNFQPAASPTMEHIGELSTILNVVIIAIMVLVTALLAWCMWRYNARRNPVPAQWSHNTFIEIAWTAIPALILLVIALPSFRLLYFMDRTQEAEMTLKVTGHQWYWSYDYPDQNLQFDAMIVSDDELQPGQLRLLTTDREVVLPVGVPIRVLLTADDVIHSWAVPSLGVKTDTVPGRLNETWIRIDRPGTYYGQCSELCGVNHGFMPIMIRAVEKQQFHAWADETRARFAQSQQKPKGGKS